MSKACHAIPPAVAKSIQEIERAPRVSNLPCPEKTKKTIMKPCYKPSIISLKQLKRDAQI